MTRRQFSALGLLGLMALAGMTGPVLANDGGFWETTRSTDVRARVRMALPERGPFRFPAPYLTTGVRLTNASDMGGRDALWPCGMSYWANINAHMGWPFLIVFLGIDRQRGGAGPSLYVVDKATGQVTPHGPIFPAEHPLSWSTGEGWYWSARDPFMLYASDPTHLYQVDVRTKTVTTVVDIAEAAERYNVFLWQWHTSVDDQMHSATWKNGTSSVAEGSVVFRGSNPVLLRPTRTDLDECQIDAGGEWLLIKDNVDHDNGEDNLIIRVADLSERLILDQAGAAGHSDNGFGYMVAADNHHPLPNAIRVWAFDANQEPQGRVVYHGPTWDGRVDHLSHGNASRGPLAAQWVVGSGASRLTLPRSNEIIAFPLDGSLRVAVLAPVMTDLDAPGGGAYDYAKLPKANVDRAGEWVLWTSNAGGDRLDAFMVRVPHGLLV